ncbi:MAG: glycine betaine ABC transporter substrate-binding protein [Desulfovibrio sp.]|uniref:glycine betaine ABC transporter substrate-binding protein n=1 Tax=Desulfovibrio sp. TaxID=885 RepID=UPI00135D8B11|nr:glycine betaine ABC transporter substrate-binding protein [Desulfovibrio sp.]MTJ91666.1 glycine betaine ABC transporter substrate-binding protein [Desulfovibrio sp.]
MARRFFILFLAVMVWAFPGQGVAADKAGKTLKIVYVDWDCAVASSNLVKAVLEERYGYRVELLPVSQEAMWTSVASGAADAMVAAWLPDTHADMYARVKNKVEMLGKLVGGARLGLAVPDYVSLRSIDELEANADRFNGRIVGIDPGAGIMRLTAKALKDYEITQLQLVPGSGPSMAASLAEAIRTHEWIVVTAWSPHWMFSRWPMHYLDDPLASLGKDESIFKIGREGLKKDHPEVWAFLSNFRFEDATQLQRLMDWNQQRGTDPVQNALRFMKENPRLVDSWFKK